MWRSATADDDRAIVRLYMALNKEDPGTTPADPAQAQRTLALFRDTPERGHCVVLDQGGGSVEGYALLVSYWSNELGGLVCCVDEMYVAPQARGLGRGTGSDPCETSRFGERSRAAARLDGSRRAGRPGHICGLDTHPRALTFRP